MSSGEKSMYVFHEKKNQHVTSPMKKNQLVTSFTNKNRHTTSTTNRISFKRRKIIVKFYEEKNKYTKSFTNKNQHAQSFANKKSACKWIHKQIKFHEEKN